MTLDARELKERYREKWAKSNARERFVLAALNAFLPRPWHAELTGLGAGSDEYVDAVYSSPMDAFDITLYHGGTPIAWVDVTGVESSESMKRHECPGRCVASWKMRKAREFRVVDRLWFAFVVDENLAVYWLSARWLDQHIEAPIVTECRLYRDERTVYCASPAYWKRFKHFKNWLVHTALYQTLAARA